MPLTNKQKIRELTAKIKVLEEENSFLSDRAEDTLLLRLVAEHISFLEDGALLIENVLEKISVAKDIPFCACMESVDEHWRMISTFASFAEQNPEISDFQIGEKARDWIENGFLQHGISEWENAGLILNLKDLNFYPQNIAVIPFPAHGYLNAGVFLFADDNADDRLSSQLMLLDHIISMICEKLDSISMAQELKTMNKYLEQRVAIRTKEIQSVVDQLNGEITRRKAIEEKLRAQEEHYRLLVENQTDYILKLDLHGVLQFISPSFAQLINREIHQSVGTHFNELILKSDRPKATKTFDQIAQTGSTYKLNVRFKTTNGTRWISWNLSLTKNRNFIIAVGRDITEQRLAEQEIRNSEVSYRALFDGAGDAIYILDKNGKFINVNHGAELMYGYKREDFTGKSPEFLSAPDKNNMRAVKAMIDRAFNGENQQFEFWGLRKNGEIFPKEVRLNPGNYFGKNVVIAFGLDITDRKKAEQALRESEQKFKQLIENLPDAIFVTGTGKESGQILDINPAAEQMTGYSREELLGMNVVDDLCTTPISRIQQKLNEEKILKHQTISFVEKKKRKNKSDIWTEVVATAINLQGKSAVLSVNRDITEIKKAQEEIHKLYRSVEQSPVSIILTNLLGEVEYVNPCYTTLTGYSKQEITGNHLRYFELTTISDDEFHSIWKRVAQGKNWSRELNSTRKDGSKYWEFISISPIQDDSGALSHIMITKEDISEPKQLQSNLSQAQKMESIGTLAGGIAHDFNNLLTVINGQAELSLMRSSGDSKFERELNVIIESCRRASNMTRQLLAFSRKQIIEPRIVNINQLITDLGKMLKRLIGEDIKTEMVLEPDVPNIMADPGQIEQVMINLLVNARDALYEQENATADKVIIIKTKKVFLDEDFVELHSGSSSGLHVLISVSDNGVGIEDDLAEKIFDPFFTTKEMGKGTGLGLSTVYGIVKQNKGSVYLTSAPGQGACFDIYWPGIIEKELTLESEKFDEKAYRGTEKILLVEDDSGVRQFARSALEHLGYSVVEADNGKNAIVKVMQDSLEPDIIVTDLIMPELNGKQMVEKLKMIIPDTPVVYTSGYTDDYIVRNGELKPGINFIQKPYTIFELVKKIREML